MFSVPYGLDIDVSCLLSLGWQTYYPSLRIFIRNGFLFPLQMAHAPSAARKQPNAATSKADGISDEEIERQLKALGVD